ncbi:MAG TPA: 50S ribosomal protein L23 [Candidatus Paceibacterota bacterium]|jgi:large subunit ribosomal protein L23|nr:50S ribosomal protein L23 [Candidatus Paceibacterota bacterium]HRZ29833.1 50S ribosomal protein L23 [Candidatus Paceibacterota bacterium]
MSPLFGKKTVKKEKLSKTPVVDKATDQDEKNNISLSNIHFDTYLQPYITEKSNALSADNKYVFIVLKRSNKALIKQLVEKNYKVKVDKINIIFLNVAPTRFGFKKTSTRKGGYKKAIVTLKEGYKIDLAI